MLSSVPRVYPLLGLCAGYLLVLFFNPVRLALRDGFRCIIRYKRIWLTFVLLGFAYSVFQFATFTPLQQASDLDLNQVADVRSWTWPQLSEVWRETPLPALEGVAGIFDNATTTYPLSVVAAIMLLLNWRGLHGALLRALRERFKAWGYLIYLVLVLSALASLFKPVVFWRLPAWGTVLPVAGLLKISAGVDAAAFIFEYLFGVYVQVYLITVCLAWIKGLSFTEQGLFKFAVRRFSYVLKWAGVVVLAGTLLVRLPLLLAYFIDLPGVLDYQPVERYLMSTLLVLFCSVQISLTLHNESLRAAICAHWQFIQRNALRLGWFLLIAALHFFLLTACDAIVRGAAADRVAGIILWKGLYVCARGLVTGWLLASWVCLFRQCETGRINQEAWIKY
ncbi:MAG: hypothetical protein H0U88_00100 [Chthoniobacterales bacterium]|nr:hypothetical protein [Chthoniobacterales bacterium]